MDNKIIIIYLYTGLTLFSLSIYLISDLRWQNIFLGLMMMWIVFMIYNLGCKNAKSSYNKTLKIKYIFQKNESLKIFSISILMILFSLYVSNYYTGNTVIDVIQSLSSGTNSLYNSYQINFVQTFNTSYSIQRIVSILMLFCIKFSLIYFYVYYFILQKPKNIINILSIINFTLAHLFFGMSRGTNFELFEIIILIIFLLLKKNITSTKSIKIILVSFFLIVIAILIYQNNIEARNYQFNFNETSDFAVNNENIILYFSPILNNTILSLYSYFGFGIYYVSVFIEQLWLNSFESFFQYLIPSFTNIQDIIVRYIDVGVRWHPDFTSFISRFGLIIVFMLIYLLGRFNTRISKYHTPLKYLTEYMIILGMFSLFIGNFILNVSSSLLIVLMLILYWINEEYLNIKLVITKKNNLKRIYYDEI